MSTAAARSPLDDITYADLYRRWERGNWRATEIDFSSDREHWEQAFTEHERKAALWNYALFFWGEDAVADGLSPYIDAAPTEEQKYFLATQQVDEARHAVFFDRFMKQVVGIEGDSVGAGLEAIAPQLTWGFEKVFGRLERMCDELRADPSIPRLAAAVALYHVVIEATLAQPGQHFITRYLADRDVMPGFRAGMENIAADEQRHIGFGVKLLSDLRRMDPEVPHAVADLLREVIPWVPAVLVPPNLDMSYIECFGVTYADVGEEGATSLEAKLRSAGLALDDLPGPAVFPIPGSPRERAERGLSLIRAGYMGEKDGPPSRSHEDLALLFEIMATRIDADAASEPGTIQWEFEDAEPWHVVVANGATRAEAGRAAAPRVTMRTSLEDFVDVFAQRQDARTQMLRRRLRPRGDLRWLARSRGMFGG